MGKGQSQEGRRKRDQRWGREGGQTFTECVLWAGRCSELLRGFPHPLTPTASIDPTMRLPFTGEETERLNS